VSAVTGPVRRWLRLEGLAMLALCLAIYWLVDANWLTFALLFLAPDLSFLGYLAGPRRGAVAYNVAHSYTLPFLLATAALLLEAAVPVRLALIWIAHLGFDRALGFGLKYPTAFADTHLGTRRERTTPEAS
jgi:hypothetical protein